MGPPPPVRRFYCPQPGRDKRPAVIWMMGKLRHGEPGCSHPVGAFPRVRGRSREGGHPGAVVPPRACGNCRRGETMGGEVKAAGGGGGSPAGAGRCLRLAGLCVPAAGCCGCARQACEAGGCARQACKAPLLLPASVYPKLGIFGGGGGGNPMPALPWLTWHGLVLHAPSLSGLSQLGSSWRFGGGCSASRSGFWGGPVEVVMGRGGGVGSGCWFLRQPEGGKWRFLFKESFIKSRFAPPTAVPWAEGGGCRCLCPPPTERMAPRHLESSHRPCCQLSPL